MNPLVTCNRALDAVATPEVFIAGRRFAAFRVFGVAGFVLAISLAVVLALREGLAALVILGLAASAVCVFLAVAMARKVLTGEEALVYYHHEIAVVLASAVFLRALGYPGLPYLDIVVLALGVFLAAGRIGCFFAGCCHGAPHLLGVRYGDAHVAAGFPACFAGARLFPVQLVECVAVLLIVARGIVLAAAGAPGAALAFYSVGYCTARFLIEFARGDSGRPYLLGLSQPQWISVLQVVAAAAAELAGWLPLNAGHLLAAAIVLGLAGARIVLAGSWGCRLLDPRHATEIAEAVRALEASPQAAITAGTTSLGIRISGARLPGDLRHFAFSCVPQELTEPAARTLAKLILRVQGAAGPYEVRRGRHGVFHLLASGDIR